VAKNRLTSTGEPPLLVMLFTRGLLRQTFPNPSRRHADSSAKSVEGGVS
jgi:hypothetical protein